MRPQAVAFADDLEAGWRLAERSAVAGAEENVDTSDDGANDDEDELPVKAGIDVAAATEEPEGFGKTEDSEEGVKDVETIVVDADVGGEPGGSASGDLGAAGGWGSVAPTCTATAGST
ncbi:unnamed protein product [Prorocentrum cordatum]|uniref:Uncharacterized protein n=1 Tax=Prorocentrum cordatum TaxID=2364126 RepID=A0ABN9XWU3_9DINO|nr:unnamed protein product [Polarella glacialis]